MRITIPLLLLMLGAVLAGCTGSSDATGDDLPIDPAADFVVPEVPAVDAVALLAQHAAFVTANPERAANVATHESSREALLGYFASYGLETYRHNFTNGIPQANIMGMAKIIISDG